MVQPELCVNEDSLYNPHSSFALRLEVENVVLKIRMSNSLLMVSLLALLMVPFPDTRLLLCCCLCTESVFFETLKECALSHLMCVLYLNKA